MIKKQKKFINESKKIYVIKGTTKSFCTNIYYIFNGETIHCAILYKAA